MARKDIPEAWIGERVALRYWRGDGRVTVDCKLEAVSKRGVAVTIEVEGESWTRFYPWGAVLHIQLGRWAQGSGFQLLVAEGFYTPRDALEPGFA